jgi:predicted metal-dependent HD superfamily phosphohydrolase
VNRDKNLLDTAVLAGGLEARYNQPHRRYHNTEHIRRVLAAITLLDPDPTYQLELELAAWFHDAIYAPGRGDNEERSAFLAKDTLELVGASPAVGAEVARLVLLTAQHNPDPVDGAGSVLCDADLSILGSAPDDYTAYAVAIRDEYSLIPNDVFRSGRAQILQQLLARPNLFHTTIGQARWESIARANLQQELAELLRTG